MRILGIDPGLATVGFSILDSGNGSLELVDCGCILTNKKHSLPERLHQIKKDLEGLIEKYKPDIAAIENIFFGKNIKTAREIAYSVGVIMELAASHKLKLVEYKPNEIKKKITSYGKADKNQIKYMVKNILGLKTLPSKDDTADALALAICCSYDFSEKL